MSSRREDPEKKRERGRRWREEKRADPEWQERERERNRRYRRENREAISERRRAARTDPMRGEREREVDRLWWQKNREEINQRRRDRDEHRLYQARKMTDPMFRESEMERKRRYRAENREVISQRRKLTDPPLRARRAHGPQAAETLAAMWERQSGCCYLCGDDLTRGKAVIDHDHACCPTGKTCTACRRGIACNRCNMLIGMVDDAPDLLRLIADNLETALLAARARIAKTSQQAELPLQ